MLRQGRSLLSNNLIGVRFMSSKDGEAGSIRAAGDAFAKKEKAQEDQYFRQLQAKQLGEMKDHHKDEIAQKEREIKRLKDDIKERKAKLAELEKK